jgi:sulfate adenylyltransferase subunit 1 (EFTu-like GTPase family)
MKFCLEYATENRHYAHTDCPGHADFIKNMITGEILRIKTLYYFVTQMLIFQCHFFKFIISQIGIELGKFYIQ